MFYPKGGTTMVTVKQVGECIAGALERVQGARAYPVGWYNINWKEWLEKFSADLGMPKQVVSIPTFLYKFAARGIAKQAAKKGHEPGLDMVKFASMMTAETFIDPAVIRDELGVQADDIDGAIRESAEVCRTLLDDPNKPIVEMAKDAKA